MIDRVELRAPRVSRRRACQQLMAAATLVGLGSERKSQPRMIQVAELLAVRDTQVAQAKGNPNIFREISHELALIAVENYYRDNEDLRGRFDERVFLLWQDEFVSQTLQAIGCQNPALPDGSLGVAPLDSTNCYVNLSQALWLEHASKGQSYLPKTLNPKAASHLYEFVTHEVVHQEADLVPLDPPLVASLTPDGSTLTFTATKGLGLVRSIPEFDRVGYICIGTEGKLEEPASQLKTINLLMGAGLAGSPSNIYYEEVRWLISLIYNDFKGQVGPTFNWHKRSRPQDYYFYIGALRNAPAQEATQTGLHFINSSFEGLTVSESI